jgi:chromosome segregation ATPase
VDSLVVPAVLGAVAAVAGAVGAYTIKRRETKGTIDTSTADSLWTEARTMRHELRDEVDRLRADASERVEDERRLRDEVAALRVEATSRREEAAKLRAEVVILREEGVVLREETAALRTEMTLLRAEGARLRDHLRLEGNPCPDPEEGGL